MLAIMFDRRRFQTRNFCVIIKASQLDRCLKVRVLLKVLGLRCRHRSTLQCQALNRWRTQLGKIVRFRKTQITLCCNVKPNRLYHRRQKVFGQPGRRKPLMLIVNIMVRSIFWEIMKQMANIVEKRRGNQLRRRSRILGSKRSLQRMF